MYDSGFITDAGVPIGSFEPILAALNYVKFYEVEEVVKEVSNRKSVSLERFSVFSKYKNDTDFVPEFSMYKVKPLQGEDDGNSLAHLAVEFFPSTYRKVDGFESVELAEDFDKQHFSYGLLSSIKQQLYEFHSAVPEKINLSAEYLCEDGSYQMMSFEI